MSNLIDEDEMSELKPGIILSEKQLESALCYIFGGDHDLMRELIMASHKKLSQLQKD